MANFNRAPYYDDFDENKKFLQILFQPGRPVQARELTQLQSILQNQIERGGSHIFKHGSKVFSPEIIGGEANYDNNGGVKFIKIAPNDKNGTAVDVSNFVGKRIKDGGISGVDVEPINGSGIVVSASANVAGDAATLFVRWDGPLASLPIDTVLQTFDPSGVTTSYYTANVISTDADYVGDSSIYETSPGVYFVNGRYVKTDGQLVVLSKYATNPTYRIGFDIIETTVSSSDDSSLLDPASGFSNYTGSGADRFKIDLVLTKKGDGTTISQFEASNTVASQTGELAATNTFFEIARVVDGRLVRHARTAIYSQLEKALARRLYDQSGNFTVEPSTAKVVEKGKGPAGSRLEGGDKYLFGVEGGKSYVFGYEYDNKGQTQWIPVPKPRTTEIVTQDVPVMYTNYIKLHDTQNNISEGMVTSGLPAKGFFDVYNQPRISLFSQDASITDSALGANNQSETNRSSVLLSANIYNSILVGTARAEALVYDKSATADAKNLGFQGRSYRLYLRNFESNYVEGKSNGVNQIDVTQVEYNAGVNPNVSFYKINASSAGMTGLGEHGFANGSEYSSDDFSSGADYVTISGFTHSEWNKSLGRVISANSTGWIGVKSVYENSTNDATSSTVIAGNNGIITRTTRSGISPRRLILLDETSRALWSDAYNGSVIEIVAGPGKGDRRRIVDYIGGSSSSRIHTYQGAGETGYVNSLDLQGMAKRGLALVDREFSAVPTRDTQYRIDFSIKNARSVGINANTFANGQSTADLRYLREREFLTGQADQHTIKSVGASPNFTTLWNIDAVGGVTPERSLGDFNTELTGGIYRGRRVEGDAVIKGGTGAKLLGATGRTAVKTLKTVDASGNDVAVGGVYSNTNFMAQRVIPSQTAAGSGNRVITIAMSTRLYSYSGTSVGQQRWYPIKTLTREEIDQFIHVVDQTTGRVVDFSEPGGGVVIADGGSASGHTLTITLPTAGYTASGKYDVLATVLHKNVEPRTKTLVKANAAGLAPGVSSSGGYNLSNGQIVIAAAGGNNALTEIKLNREPGGHDSLGISDVYSVKVLQTGDTATVITDAMVQYLANDNATLLATTGANNITENYRLDTGQRNHLYDHGSLVLKSGYNPGNGHVLALVDYFSHSGSDVATGTDGSEPKYFAVDSYQFTEDITTTASHGFVEGDILQGNTSGVKGRILDVPSATTLRLVSITPNGANEHFIVSEYVNDMNAASTSSKQITGDGVTPIEISYENIPVFPETRYELRDCLDFRPRREDGDLKSNAAATNIAIPLDCTAIDMRQYPDVVPSFKLASYLGRIDKVVLKKSRDLKLIQGVAGIVPKPPSDDPDAMTLFRVVWPPYGFSTSGLGGPLITRSEHKRYTMKDISRIDKRIRNLEYYVALNALERMAKDEVVADSQGLNRFKNGILTDNFNAFNTVRPQFGETVHDTPHGHREYTYGMNRSRGHLVPALSTNSVSAPFTFANSSSENMTTSGLNGEVITLDWNEVIWNDGPKQLMATQSKEYENDNVTIINDGEGDGRVALNPFNMFNYNGNLTLNPNFDNFIDQLDAGESVRVNLTGASDAAAFGNEPNPADGTIFQLNANPPITSYGSWEENPGTQSNPATLDTEEYTATGASGSLASEWSNDIQDRYHATLTAPTTFSIEAADSFVRTWASVTTIPESVISRHENTITRAEIATYMRSKDVTVMATGMKPSTPLYAFFDGSSVLPYMSSCDMIRFDSNCDLGSLSRGAGANGFIQETLQIQGQLTSTAKLVAVRGNTAFITDIKHASASPSSKFSDDDIVLVGNTTGITQAVSAQQIDSGLPINADQSYEHRSGYARPIATSARNNANWIRLAPEAPSYTNAIAANSMAWGSDIEDTQHQGVWMTSIQIVKGKNAGKRGLITYYDGSTREAHVEWSSDPDLDTGVDANGVLASESQDYYTLGSSRYPDATIFTSFTGEYFGTFHLPSNDNTKFTTGTKNLLLNDRSDNNPFLIKTWATAAYQASGTVNHLIDEVVATRDTVVGSVGSGMELEYRSHAGQSFIEATRISDGVKGVLHAVVDIDIISQGGRNVRLAEGASDAGSSSNPYLPYFETVSSFTWFSYSTHTNQPSGTAGVRGGGAPYLMGKVVGATSIDGIEWNYTPTPVTDGVGRACSDWNVMYATQAGEDSFRAAKTGQIHSHHPGASCGAWRFGSQRSSFPSLIPLGGNMGGCKAFATVEDGRIVDATITDHGCAVVNREDGEEAVGPVWRAVYYKNGWQLGDSSAGAQNFPHMFVGRSVVSSDPDVIRAKVPYINQMMSDIEAGVLARNAAASVTGQDPLAQSFTIPADGPGASPHGVFLNGVDLWFVEKPTAGDNTEVGVTVEIRRMVNGYPDSVGPIPCVAGSSQAMAEVPAANINVRNNQAETVAGGTGLLDVNDENSYTTFTFPAPVYLLPGVDYCFVVRCAGSKDYYLWSADYRGHVLGTRTPMETAKPLGQFDGSLFLSQNAKTWEPDQYKDLMFRLRRCNFTGSTGTAVFTAGANVRRRLRDEEGNEMGSIGEVQLESDYDFDFFRVNEEHIIPLDDEGLNSRAIQYQYLAPDTSDTNDGYHNFTPATTIHPDKQLRLNGNRKWDNGSFQVKGIVNSTSDNKVSPVFDLSTMELIAEKWHLNDGGIEDKHITVDGPVGASYAAGDIFKLDVIKTNADGTTSSAMANSDIGYIQADNVDGGKIYSMNVYPTGALTAGRNYSETPTVVEHDVSGSGIGNTSVTISGETNRLGGNARFRYVTKPVKLKQQASDIAVFMDAHKPRNTEVHVYYKVRHRDDPELLDDKNWIKMKQTSPTDGLHSVTKSAWTVGQSVPMTEHRFSTGSQNDMIQYESSTFGHLVKFDGFKYFAIKIVGFADNHATPPTVASLRAIAVT